MGVSQCTSLFAVQMANITAMHVWLDVLASMLQQTLFLQEDASQIPARSFKKGARSKSQVLGTPRCNSLCHPAGHKCSMQDARCCSYWLISEETQVASCRS